MLSRSFTKSYDVLVAGGGIAGVSAAIASAREGMNTVLIEKTVMFGGLATSGLILVYLPLSDSYGNQVTFGLAEELLHASIKYGPGDIPSDWHDPNTPSRYSVWFSPASFALTLDEILLDAGVELWLDTLICDAIVENSRVVGVEVENKSGRGIIKAKCVIDATGDADVAYRAGASCTERDNWLSIWSIETSLKLANSAVSEGSGSKLSFSRRLGASDTGKGAPEGMKKFYGTNGKDVSEFILEGRKLLREFYKKEQSKYGSSGRNDIFPVALPSMAQFRMTRRIVGMETLGSDDHDKHFNDCVGVIADWRDGKVLWEIPYYTLVQKDLKGLLSAGRCISADGEAWQATRVIQASALTGEIAGVIASIAIKNDTTPDRLDVKLVQSQLKNKGFLININELNR